MFIRTIGVDRWSGGLDLGTTVEAIDWAQVEDAIRKLDGRVATMVLLAAENESHMAIGSGEHGKFIVYATFGNETFHNLIDASKTDEQVELCVGGQYGEYPGHMCADIAKVLLAAQTFAVAGRLDDSLDWEVYD